MADGNDAQVPGENNGDKKRMNTRHGGHRSDRNYAKLANPTQEALNPGHLKKHARVRGKNFHKRRGGKKKDAAKFGWAEGESLDNE